MAKEFYLGNEKERDMKKSKEAIEEHAIEIVDKLLQHGLITTSEAVVLIRAITDKGGYIPAQPVYPTNVPNVPLMPNTPGIPDYPWKPGIVYCSETGQNAQQWNTTIC